VVYCQPAHYTTGRGGYAVRDFYVSTITNVIIYTVTLVHFLDHTIFFGLPSNYFWYGMFCKAAGHNSTHLCTFSQIFLSWILCSV